MKLVNMGRRALSLAVFGCCVHAQGWALSAGDFQPLFSGGGQAVDINDKGLVLVNVDKGFQLVARNGTVTAVDLSSQMAAGGYVGAYASDLSNNDHVVGTLTSSTGTSGFFWSAGSGVVLIPSAYASRVNDNGVTVGRGGYWSQSAGAVSASTLLTDSSQLDSFALMDIDNEGRLAFVGPYIPQTMSSSSKFTYGVMAPNGALVFSQVMYDSSLTKFQDTNTPDLMRFNGGGGLMVSWDYTIYNAGRSKVYDLSTQAVVSGATSVMYDSINAQNQAVGHIPQYGGPISQSYVYTNLKTQDSFNLEPLYANYGVPRAINSGGQVLFDGPHGFSVLQGPSASAPGTGGGATLPPGTGAGLTGQYYNVGLFGNKLMVTRVENPDFDWGSASPAAGVHSDFFSVKWTGSLEAEEAGSYVLQTLSDDSVRVTVDGQVVIDNWKSHAATINNSPALNFATGSRHSILIEYRDLLGRAVMRLKWLKPGATSAAAVPTVRLYDK